MGEFADYANENLCSSMEDLLDYQMGNLSELEAIDRGILNEFREFAFKCSLVSRG